MIHLMTFTITFIVCVALDCGFWMSLLISIIVMLVTNILSIWFYIIIILIVIVFKY